MGIGGKRFDSVFAQFSSWVDDADGKPRAWSTTWLNTCEWKVTYGHISICEIPCCWGQRLILHLDAALFLNCQHQNGESLVHNLFWNGAICHHGSIIPDLDVKIVVGPSNPNTETLQCAMRFALCALRFALCPMRSCAHLYACPMPYAQSRQILPL